MNNLAMDNHDVRPLLFLAAALSATTLASPAFAATIEVTPQDDLGTVLSALEPGDELVVADGTYALGAGVDVVLEGTMANRITVRPADGARPILSADSGDAVLRISGAFFTLDGLEITGPRTGLTLDAERAFVRNMTIDGGTTGIACTRCVQVALFDSEITGTDGDAAMRLAGTRDSTIDHSWIHDLQGTTDGIRVAAPAGGNVVRDNVVTGVGGVGISVGDDPTARLPNSVEGNWVADSSSHGIRIVGRATLVNNIVSRAGGAGLLGRMGAEGEANITVVHNTVVESTGPCLRAEDWSLSSGEVVVANNALYCMRGNALRFDDGGGFATITGNVYLGTVDRPGDSLLGDGPDDFEDAGMDNYYPSMGSALVDAANPAHAVSIDFNGADRPAAADAGAYERTSQMNPVPTPGDGFKQDAVDLPGDPAGTDDTGTTDTDAGTLDDGGGTGSSPRGNAGGATGFDERDDGCRCTTSPAASDGTVILLVLALLGVRRRR